MTIEEKQPLTFIIGGNVMLLKVLNELPTDSRKL